MAFAFLDYITDWINFGYWLCPAGANQAMGTRKSTCAS